jgi:hypothetical protein
MAEKQIKGAAVPRSMGVLRACLVRGALGAHGFSMMAAVASKAIVPECKHLMYE